MNANMLVGILIGSVGTILALAIFVPDSVGIWVVTRRNAPKWLLWIAVIVAILFVGNLVIGVVVAVFPKIHVELWAWLGPIVAIVAVVLLWMLNKYLSNRADGNVVVNPVNQVVNPVNQPADPGDAGDA